MPWLRRRATGSRSRLVEQLGHLRLVFLAAGELEISEARAECFQ